MRAKAEKQETAGGVEGHQEQPSMAGALSLSEEGSRRSQDREGEHPLLLHLLRVALFGCCPQGGQVSWPNWGFRQTALGAVWKAH